MVSIRLRKKEADEILEPLKKYAESKNMEHLIDKIVKYRYRIDLIRRQMRDRLVEIAMSRDEYLQAVLEDTIEVQSTYYTCEDKEHYKAHLSFRYESDYLQDLFSTSIHTDKKLKSLYNKLKKAHQDLENMKKEAHQNLQRWYVQSVLAVMREGTIDNVEQYDPKKKY